MFTTVTLIVVLVPALVVGCYPLWITRLLARNRLRDTAGRPHAPPPVSVIVPCRGVDAGLDRNAAAVLAQVFAARCEVLFCVESADDPAVPVIERRLRGDPAGTGRLVVTGDAGSDLGKMHNLLGGLSAATGRRLVFLDSDVRLPDAGYLERFLAGLDRPGVGLVTCFPAYRNVRNLPAAYIALTINDDLLGLFAAAGMFGPLSVANGSCMAIDREILDRAGGLDALRNQLLMDSALARNVLDAGAAVRLHEEGAPVHIGRATWRQVRRQSRRWHLAMSRVLPRPVYLGFAWLRSGFLLGSLAFAATGGDRLVGGALAFSLLVRLAVAWWLERRHLHGGALARHQWLLPAIEWINGWDALTAPLDAVARWRGRVYRVDGRGRTIELREPDR